MLVHRYWSGDRRPEYSKFTGEVLKSLGSEVQEWGPQDIPKEIQTIIDHTKQFVKEKDYLRHESNVFRLWALYEYGGVYVDHDVILCKPLPELPRPMPWAASHHDFICSCLLSIPKGSQMLTDALISIIDYKGELKGSPHVSGEAMLQQTWPSIIKRELPFDSLGRVIQDSDIWAVHLYATSRVQ